MALLSLGRCDTCFTRSGHVCLWCGETNVEVEGIVRHQERKNHYGGHYVKSRSRRRDVPVRFREDHGQDPVAQADEPQEDGSDDDGSKDEEDDEAILCRFHNLEDDIVTLLAEDETLKDLG